MENAHIEVIIIGSNRVIGRVIGIIIIVIGKRRVIGSWKMLKLVTVNMILVTRLRGENG